MGNLVKNGPLRPGAESEQCSENLLFSECLGAMGAPTQLESKHNGGGLQSSASNVLTIAALGSLSWREREQASELLKQDPSTLPLLRAALSIPNPEVRRRAEGVISYFIGAAYEPGFQPERVVASHNHFRLLMHPVPKFAERFASKERSVLFYQTLIADLNERHFTNKATYGLFQNNFALQLLAAKMNAPDLADTITVDGPYQGKNKFLPIEVFDKLASLKPAGGCNFRTMYASMQRAFRAWQTIRN